MKIRRFVLVLILLQISLSGELMAQYTLTMCQQKAAENYPLARQYGLIESSKDFNLKNAGTSYLPQLAFQAKASYQSDVTEIPISIPGITIEPSSKDQYSASVQVDQTIWDGGVTSVRKGTLRKQSELERSKLDVDIYAIRERVNQTYFGIILIDRQIDQVALLKGDLNRNLNRVEAYMANGLANQSDLDAIKVEILNALQKETELHAAKRAYISVLFAMMGEQVDFNAKFENPDDLEVSNEIRRPELSMLKVQSELYDIQAGMIHAQLRPRIGAYIQAGYGRPGLNVLKNEFSPFYIAGIKAVWSIGGLYTKKSDLSLLELNKKSVGIKRDAFLYNTNLQVIMQTEEISKIRELLGRDDEVIDLREKIQKASEAKLESGTISVSDLLHEVNQLDAARVTKARHDVELMMAIYNLKNTTNN